MKCYLTTGKISKESIRRLGANHIYHVWWGWGQGITNKEDKFLKELLMFQAEDDFGLFCKISTGHEIIEIAERQYKRVVKGESVKLKDPLNMKLSEIVYSNVGAFT